MRADHVLHLGVKELRSLARDPIMLALIVFAFSASIVAATRAMPETLNEAPIAVVDEDRSPLSQRIVDAFAPPYFLPPRPVTPEEMDARMDAGLDTFALDIPPGFQADVLAGRSPAVQLNVDATRMGQAFAGGGYVRAIVEGEVREFVRRHRDVESPPIGLAVRVRFNPNLEKARFTAVMKLIDQVTMLAIILTGAALIRERERGTIEHLLAMPVTPLEIMASKIWSMGLAVLAACACSLVVVVRGLLEVPIEGSAGLFLLGAAVHLFATTSMGIVLGTFARSMPQLGLLIMLVLLPLQMLSGGMTPRESMPGWVRTAMLGAPTTHFVMLAQGVLDRGAGFGIVWPQLLALGLIGAAFFGVALARFRRAIGAPA